MKAINKKEYLTLIDLIELNNSFQFVLDTEIQGIKYELTTYKESGIYFVKGFINNKHIQQSFETIKECRKYLKSITI